MIAEAFVPDDRIERMLHTTAADLETLSWAGTHGAVASGMQSVAFTPATAIAAVFAATGQDLGMVGTSSMAHGTARRVEGGLHASIRFPGLEVGTIGGGTTLPSARDWLDSIDCAGTGKVYRFAQIVAAAALCLELSASASMATAGQRELLQRPPRTRRPAVIALVFSYDVAGDAAEFERVYGPEGEWAQFFRAAVATSARSSSATPRSPAATWSSTAGSRARPTTNSSRRTATSTCAASTRPRSSTITSYGSGRSRRSGEFVRWMPRRPATSGVSIAGAGMRPDA